MKYYPIEMEIIENISSFILDIKINKFILYIAHLFGYRKDEEHMDNITINIDRDIYDDRLMNILLLSLPNKRYVFFGNDESHIENLVDDIKKRVYKILSDNSKLEKRCENVKQVYLTFYASDDKVRKGSIIKIMMYRDKKLYYTYDTKEAKRYERDCALETILS